MPELPETPELPAKRFTEIRSIMLVDRVVGFASCLECGAGVFIDPEDRKNDIHPMAIHIEWHDGLTETLDETVQRMINPTPQLFKEIVESNKAEFIKEATDVDRQVRRTEDVPNRREVEADRVQAPRTKPVPGLPREGRGQGQGTAGRPRPPQG